MMIVGISLILMGIFLFLLKLIFRPFNNNYPQKLAIKNPHYAVLIPARGESLVIEDLLLSIKKQTMKIDMNDVYVIVEDIKDKTVSLAHQYQVNVIVRKKLHLKRKGYALMEALEEITKDKMYDAYFIFDADNVLDNNYFKEMTKTFLKGYDIGIGYRNIKNKDNAIAVSSGLIFTIINVLSNRNRSLYSLNCNASGTGFYLSGKIVNELKTYPFHSLTEDYELSLYACIHNLTTFYNDKAMFYDEQPVSIKTYYNQRTRWVAGYFEARQKYFQKLFKCLSFKNPNFASVYETLIGIYDLLLIIIGIVFIILSFLLESSMALCSILWLIISIYCLLILFTLYLILVEKRFNLTAKLKIQTLFLHPFLLFLYLPCLFKVLFSSNIEWKKIEHSKRN